MTYTEIQERNSKKYYYRVKSIKKKGRVSKKRVYLGVNLTTLKLAKKEQEADTKLNNSLNALLTKEQKNKLKFIQKKFKTTPTCTFENRYEAFVAKFTHDSNAIEGNTINLQETSLILFEHTSPPGKTLREINEVLNHKKAFDFILSYHQDITKKFICEIQKLVTQNTLKEHLKNQVGIYRTVQVYIRGAKLVPSKPQDIVMQIRSLLRWYNSNKARVHPLILAAYFHIAFEAVHPFVDGNGRTGRLLLNFILHRHRFPMVSIPYKRKLDYYGCLEEAQVNDNLQPFIQFLYEILCENEFYI